MTAKIYSNFNTIDEEHETWENVATIWLDRTKKVNYLVIRFMTGSPEEKQFECNEGEAWIQFDCKTDRLLVY